MRAWNAAEPVRQMSLESGDAMTSPLVMRVTVRIGTVEVSDEIPCEPGDDFGAVAAWMARKAAELIDHGFDLS
jgi:hypothetical protein